MSVKIPGLCGPCGTVFDFVTYSPSQPIISIKGDFTTARYERWKEFKARKLTKAQRQLIETFAREAL